MNSLLPELAGIWAMEPAALRGFIELISKIDEASLIAAYEKRVQAGTMQAFQNLQAGGEATAPLDIRDGVAHIAIKGPMMRQVPSLMSALGIQATSTTQVRRDLGRAIDDDQVRAIQLDIDSPGGAVDGTAELAADVAAARDLKPVTADVRGTIASAAYWVGSQASRITMSPTGLAGSIGVATVLRDSSKAAEAAGVKVHVIASHELKGIGIAEGAPISASQLTETQRLVDTMTTPFIEGVISGRKNAGMTDEEARKLATGQVWVGAQAKELKLVDEINVEKKESAVDQKEVDKLRAEHAAAQVKIADLEKGKAQLEAKATADASALAEALKNQREQLITKHAKRVSPAMLEHVREYGATLGADVGKFEAYLKSLPVAVHDDPAGGSPDPEGQVELSGDDKAIGELFALSPEVFKKFKGAKFVDASTGLVHFEDGSVRKVS